MSLGEEGVRAILSEFAHRIVNHLLEVSELLFSKGEEFNDVCPGRGNYSGSRRKSTEIPSSGLGQLGIFHPSSSHTPLFVSPPPQLRLPSLLGLSPGHCLPRVFRSY